MIGGMRGVELIEKKSRQELGDLLGFEEILYRLAKAN